MYWVVFSVKAFPCVVCIGHERSLLQNAVCVEYVLQDWEPRGAIDLRGYLIVKTVERGVGTQKFSFKLVKYGTSVDRHCFRCRTEHDFIR